MKKLTDRTAVITGAGSGIGRATSLLLAEKGCRLALSDINKDGLEETAQLVRERGRPVTTHVVDVANRERMKEFADEVVAEHGAAHILVNNAGVAVNATFLEHSLDDFEWLMGINFWGVVYGCKFFLPHLLTAGEGHIVNISSLFGLLGVPQQSSYCASKFAVRGFTETLRVELRNSNVGVTSVHPGGVATNIAAGARVTGDERAMAAHQRAVKAFSKMLPPTVAAAAIVNGILRDRARVLIARETYLADSVKRLLPEASVDLLAWGYQRYRARMLGH
jgi:NAD(P)-dependent dehydrogenase (short-subunit alcohol dehydrogenase family)